MPDPLVGRTVGGAYLLQELVGVGGMGRVYRAEQNMLGRTVAVKVIHPHLLSDDQTVARFYNEARAASRLNHPDSVSIIDFGRTDDGILYLVMEYLGGADLAQLLADEGPLPFVRICRVLRHVLSALGEAHALGVVHRDLKPENVIVRKVRRGAEQVKVVDFGLAHIVGPGGTSITTPGLVCGTPDYMSPEQGRGEEVDGRGDIYSVGVVLYEMLTDRLPFEEDTPTKVVFRHIHDPVPDPREIAPHRAIPDTLAEICLRSLAKKREDRYQSADEMFEAVRLAEEALEAAKSQSLTACPVCGAANPAGVRFCGECGTRVTDRFTIPPSFRSGAPPARTSLAPAPSRTPLIGRRAELDRLLDLHTRASTVAMWVRITGEAGVGKSRVLAELARRIGERGDIVVAAGPHPSGAPVSYFAVRELLRILFDVPEARLKELAESGVVGDPVARAGIREALEPEGLAGCPGEGRAAAVGVALSAAVRVAAGRAESGRVTLLVDDFDRCDSLSRAALEAMMRSAADAPLFLSSAAVAARDPEAEIPGATMPLRGLDHFDAERMLNGEGDDERPVDMDTPLATRLFTPLYLEQLRALGFTDVETDELPPRLADAVLQRLERLDLGARRLLQTAAVLGDSTELDVLRQLAREEDIGSLSGLLQQGLLDLDGQRVSFCHPFVRDLVESSIPAEARKELHASALDLAGGGDAPLEVRAEHAFRAGEPMIALLLLERMGDRALTRGDGSASVLAFRRGLELARRELVLTGETALDRAIVTFSRNLGAALDADGDTVGADGVLREALELAGPADRQRPKMLLLLGRVATRRRRPRDATRFLGQALELSARQRDVLGEAEANLALGELRLEDDDPFTASETFQRALAALKGEPEAALLESRLGLALGRAFAALGDLQRAASVLERAHGDALRSKSPALVARVLAARASIAERAGGSGASLYRDAAKLASEAGAAEDAARWRRLGRISDARQVG